MWPPYTYDSRPLRGQRHRWGGRTLFHVLYLATLAATRYSPVIRPHYVRLLAAGMPCEVALIACMRRLLVILNTMIRDGTAWNPQRAMAR